MSPFRAAGILSGFVLMSLIGLPLQLAAMRFGGRFAGLFPHWYHRLLCRLIGVRIHASGEIERSCPVLIVSNHISWLDIPVISALAPLSFIAKREVSTWPLVSLLAKAQRTIFVDRQSRASLAATARAVLRRLAAGERVVLFAEGTSSDGNRVLPFKSSLFASAGPPRAEHGYGEAANPIGVQTLAIAYTHLHGLPLGRRWRPLVAWYGDMDMVSHVWRLLTQGPLDVQVRIGPPIDIARFGDRRAIALHCEQEIRAVVAEMLRARRGGSALDGPGEDMKAA